MPRVQSQAGASLADTYDVVGSQVGVKNLETEDVHLFDEMGGRVFSERLLSFPITIVSGDIAQSLSFTAVVGGIPDSPNRILGVFVVADAAARLRDVAVSWRDPDGADMIIWAWAAANDVEQDVRVQLSGVAVGNLTLLGPRTNFALPSLITRTGPEAQMPDLAIRGSTLGFGAGTVEATAVIHLARANVGNPAPGAPSSHGLPVPGW